MSRLTSPLGQAETFGYLRALAAGASEGRGRRACARRAEETSLTKELQVRVVDLDQLLDRAGDLSADPLQASPPGSTRPRDGACRLRGRGCDALPCESGVDLAGSADALGFVRKLLQAYWIASRFRQPSSQDSELASCVRSASPRQALRGRGSGTARRGAVSASVEAEIGPITTTGREGVKLAPSLIAAAAEIASLRLRHSDSASHFINDSRATGFITHFWDR